MANHERPVRTVWITKYALTRGILKAEAEIIEGRGAGTVYASVEAEGLRIFTPEFKLSEADAIEAFNEMRNRKLATLERQAKKLQNLACKIVEPGDFK
jgi:hypothetical protein